LQGALGLGKRSKGKFGADVKAFGRTASLVGENRNFSMELKMAAIVPEMSVVA
jgi:hypothetical protein